jgi:hypothetical protein
MRSLYRNLWPASITVVRAPRLGLADERLRVRPAKAR